MNKIIPLSLGVLASLYATEVELAPIGVESTIITEVAQNAQTSADVAAALSVSVPSIDMSRRSGIANDILIRGQKRDNINVEVDGTKVYGACPNRMDPPASHIVANQIDSIEVTEGPFDVESFGVLSGGIKIKTKKPTADEIGEINVGFGSFGYKKFGASASGGTEKVRAVVAVSRESSDQYLDGNGDSIATQIDNNANKDFSNLKGTKLKPEYKDMEAYTKTSAMSKVFVTITKDQELRLSATANRSEDVIYGNAKMDALWDDSNIYSVAYNIKNIGDTYKSVNIQYFHSEVDHPMSNKYRMASNMMDMTSHLSTSMDGLKLKNNLLLNGHNVTVGLDASKRNWDGRYYNTTTKVAHFTPKSIDNVDTTNMAAFVSVKNSYKNVDVNFGARYDATQITHATLHSNDYSSLNANLMATLKMSKSDKIFLALGQASRVPDARELYFINSMGKQVGTDTLNQTINQEIDLGYEKNSDSFRFKIKAFYSMLQDYIYIKKGAMTNAFSNIDATIYGSELSASYFATDDISLDLGASYKVGQKSEALPTQTDTDLADIAPLRGNLALNYEYANNSLATLEVQASDTWIDIDSDNGEQELAAWTILNFKMKHALNKQLDFTFGVNNIFDETYAQSNTYADLTLITSSSTDVMLMNEPGRYVYTNIDFKF